MKYKNILQIDDDDDDCDFFHQALSSISEADYTSLHNPIEALCQLTAREINPDIIFLDINMPLMTSIGFLFERKKRDVIKNIPIIIFSTSDTQQEKKIAKTLGAEDFLTKPASLSELTNLHRQVI
ncbi:MAG: response regulator [Flavobacterium sp.]